MTARRILVTGAAGFVGSHVCEALLAAGHRVVGIDAFTDYYPRSVKEANLCRSLDSSSFAFHELDLRTADLDPILDGVDAVINEAAMPGLVRSWSDIDAYVACNILAVARLVEAARRANVRRFVQISTSSVYGTNAVGDESLPTRPVSPYGVTKLAAEELVLAHFRTFGFPALILRYFSLYGPRQRPDMAYHRFVEALLDRRPVVIYGDGLQSRANTYVADAVQGTIAALDGGAVGEIYNIGGGEPITVRAAIDQLAAALGVRPTIVFEPAIPGDQRHTHADTAKARAAFGYAPAIGPAKGLPAQAAWQRALRNSGGETPHGQPAQPGHGVD